MIGYPKHSGPMRSRVIRSDEPTGQKNYQTKPISNNPQGINGLRLVSGTAGAPSPAKPDGLLRRDTRGPLPRGRQPREPQQRNNDHRSSGAIEQQNYQTNQIPHNCHRSSSLDPSPIFFENAIVRDRASGPGVLGIAEACLFARWAVGGHRGVRRLSYSCFGRFMARTPRWRAP